MSDPRASVEARLADAVERAAVAERLTAQLAAAEAALRRAETEVERQTRLLTEVQTQIDRLEARSWSRLVRFAQGTYDEDLRAARATSVAVRTRLRTASGDLEDAQRLVGELTTRLAEFPDTTRRLDAALLRKEELLRAQRDWRAPQLAGLALRRESIQDEIDALTGALARCSAAVTVLDELVDHARRAVLMVGISPLNPLTRLVDSGVVEARRQLGQLRDELAAAPASVTGLPYAAPLPRVDLFTAEAVMGLTSIHPDVQRIRDAAVAQRRWLTAVSDRVADEVAAREKLLAEVAALRRRLLVAPDRPT